MHKSLLVRTVTLFTVMAFGLAACGSSGSTTTTTVAPDPAAAPAQIAATYQALFNFADKSIAAKEALIQDGAALQVGLSEAVNSSLSSGIGGARIDSTKLLTGKDCTSKKVTSPCASVAYAMMSTQNTVLYAGQMGFAVWVSGKWLMAKTTICALLTLFWNAEQKKGNPPGCP